LNKHVDFSRLKVIRCITTDIMKTKALKKEHAIEEYYDAHGVLRDIIDEDIDLSLEDALRKDIISGRRKRTLRNISIKPQQYKI